MNIINDEAVEVWANIPNFPFYQVSNLGRVRSLDKWVNTGRHKRLIKSNIKKLQSDKNGYYRVCLYAAENNMMRNFIVHRLVASAFLPPHPFEKNEVNHIDGVKTNNIPSNLEWVTRKENVQHSHKIGLSKIPCGAKARSVKLSELDVFAIRERIGKESYSVIAKDYGVTAGAIYCIKTGKSWSNLK